VTATEPSPAATATDTRPLLDVAHLRKEYPGARGRFGRTGPTALVVDDVSFSVGAGETLGLVGESGSGKSTTARLVSRLVEPTSGRITFDGKELTEQHGRALRAVRADLQVVFQDVTGSLNPRMTVQQLIAEPLRLHQGLSGSAVEARSAELLDLVALNRRHLERYSYELSGGQRQRVGIARALAVEPKLLVLDEPVSALDVSTQSQTVNLLQDLQAELGVAYLFIAHNLFVVHHISRRIAVMYLGAIVEVGPAEQVYEHPRHPYTEALVSAIPHPDPEVRSGRERIVLRGEVPGPTNIPSGCRFHTRCPYAFERCAAEVPALTDVGGGWSVACHLGGGLGRSEP
jgi:oligopeptide/dipeptide ABC transporter ATP-binding protein